MLKTIFTFRIWIPKHHSSNFVILCKVENIEKTFRNQIYKIEFSLFGKEIEESEEVLQWY